MAYTSGICDDCGAYRRRIEKHHVVPLSLGGADEDSNIVRICANCHQDRHHAEGMEPWQLAQSPTAKAKRSASFKRLWEDPEYRANQEANRRKHWTDERREKLSETQRLQKASRTPEEIAETARKISETKRGGRWAAEYDRCVSCSTTDLPHMGKGLCKNCYQKSRYVPKEVLTRWARKFDACIECGTTEKPHKARGFCETCYLRDYRANT